MLIPLALKADRNFLREILLVLIVAAASSGAILFSLLPG
jgi:hypothetical protein